MAEFTKYISFVIWCPSNVHKGSDVNAFVEPQVNIDNNLYYFAFFILLHGSWGTPYIYRFFRALPLSII